jgi:hypothetical protein
MRYWEEAGKLKEEMDVNIRRMGGENPIDYPTNIMYIDNNILTNDNYILYYGY